MGKLKVTLVRKVSKLPKLKSTGYSIILGRNLVKKQKEKKGEKNGKNNMERCRKKR